MLDKTLQLSESTFKSISDVRGEHVRQDTSSVPARKVTLTSRFSEDLKQQVVRNNLLFRGFVPTDGSAPTGTPPWLPYNVSLTLTTPIMADQTDAPVYVQAAWNVILCYMAGLHTVPSTEMEIRYRPIVDGTPGSPVVAETLSAELLAALRRGEQ